MKYLGLLVMILFSSSALAYEFSCPPSDLLSADKCAKKSKSGMKEFSFFHDEDPFKFKMGKDKPCVAKPSLGELQTTVLIKNGSKWVINCNYEHGKLASAPTEFKICAINEDSKLLKCEGFDCIVDCE